EGDKEAQYELAREERRHQRLRAAGMLGIADMGQAPTILAARERGLEPGEVIGALRWDTCNPWGRFLQMLSTHPLIVRRIGALETSRLPGAPRRWSAAEVAATCESPELARARRRFWLELPVRFLPWVALLGLAVGWGRDDFLLMAQAATVGGLGLLVLTTFQRPPGHGPAVGRITSLLSRLDASPVTGLPAELRGRVAGRGTPGYVLSPDLVVQDDSGFVPVLYRQPWPFARVFFGALEAERLIDQDVVVRGWYRRNPAPVFELKELRAADGTRIRGFLWVGAYLAGVAAAVIGGVAWMFLA
ncbi:MAG: protease, partial [Actinomycetes bacterium]